MTTIDRISQQANQLPKNFQREALDFIEFLSNKAKRDNERREDLDWFNFSLTAAMRCMENEDGPNYDESDLKEKWQ